MSALPDFSQNSLVEKEAAKLPKPHEWGGLALELLLEPDNAEEICETYGTTAEAVYAALDSNKDFHAAFSEAKSRIKSLGPNAGYILRAQYMAEQQLRPLQELATGPAVPPQIKLKAIEMTAKFALLDPSVQKKDDKAAGAAGVSVTFNFGAGLPTPSANVIDVEPT